MTDKEVFINQLKQRTKKFAVDIIKFCESLVECKASGIIAGQLIRSSTSVGSNYRAACRGRSKKEFFSKICIVVEEADESEYWLEIIDDANLSSDKKELKRLLIEIDELERIFSKAKDSTYSALNQKT